MPSVDVTVADAGHADVAARLLFDFNTEFDSWVPDLESLGRRFSRLLARDDVVVLLAGPTAAPDGFALLTLRPTPYYDGPVGQLDELYVRPDRRGDGIGSALLDTVVAVVRGRDGGEVHINVDEVDLDARRFYERHGFVNVEPGADYRMLCYLREL